MNVNINGIDPEYFETWEVYLDEWVDDITDCFKVKDFSKTVDSNKTLSSFNENIFCKTIPITFRKNYDFLKSSFSSKGYFFFIDSVEHLDSLVTKKDYIPENEAEDAGDINDFYKILDLDLSVVPSKKELRNAYLKESSLFHPDKHPDEKEKYEFIFSEINKAYSTLNRYYYKNENNL